MRFGCGMTINGNELMRFPKRYIIVAWVTVLGTISNAQEHPDLGKIQDYPISLEVWIGSLVGEISVNPEFPVEVNVPGKLEWKVANGQLVGKDEVITITGFEKLKLSERDLELKKGRRRNSIIDIEQDIREKKQALSDSMDGMEEKLTRMSLTDGERGLLGAEFAARLGKERAALEEVIRRSREKLAGDYFEVTEAMDLRALDLEIERAELDYKELLRGSEIVSPVAGQIVIDFNDSIRTNTVVCRIIKVGLAEARLELTDSYLRNIPGEELAIEISGEDGRTYRGHLLRLLDQRALERNAKVMVFDVKNPDENEAVPVALNGSRMIRIHRLLPKPNRIVPKKDLVFKFPKEIESRGWAAFIENRWPGVKVLYVAPRDLVVSLTNEN